MPVSFRRQGDCGGSLEPGDMDAAIAGMDLEHATATVHLAKETRAIATGGLGRDGEVDVDGAIAGGGFEVGGELIRETEPDAAIAAPQPPRGGEVRTAAGFDLDASVTALEVEAVEAALGVDVPIA